MKVIFDNTTKLRQNSTQLCFVDEHRYKDFGRIKAQGSNWVDRLTGVRRYVPFFEAFFTEEFKIFDPFYFFGNQESETTLLRGTSSQ